jgi:hypothetical protein
MRSAGPLSLAQIVLATSRCRGGAGWGTERYGTMVVRIRGLPSRMKYWYEVPGALPLLRSSRALALACNARDEVTGP